MKSRLYKNGRKNLSPNKIKENVTEKIAKKFEKNIRLRMAKFNVVLMSLICLSAAVCYSKAVTKKNVADPCKDSYQALKNDTTQSKLTSTIVHALNTTDDKVTLYFYVFSLFRSCQKPQTIFIYILKCILNFTNKISVNSFFQFFNNISSTKMTPTIKMMFISTTKIDISMYFPSGKVVRFLFLHT